MFNRLMVCVDGSAQSLVAAQATVELARKFDSLITVLNVFDPSVVHAAMTPLPDGPLATATDDGSHAHEMQKLSLLEACRIFESAGLMHSAFCELGHPVDRILRVAQDIEADLIVMGNRGKGGFQRMLMGSVSEGVLRLARCAVMIVR